MYVLGLFVCLFVFPLANSCFVDGAALFAVRELKDVKFWLVPVHNDCLPIALKCSMSEWYKSVGAP